MEIKFLQSFFHKTLAAMTIAMLAISALPAIPASAAPAFPTGFVSEAVVTNLTGPTTIAFAPDGRMFIGQKDGRVRIFQNGVLLPTDFINISSQVNNYWDRGMLGLAIHPDFPNTPYVYLLYTYDPPGTIDNGGGARVSRLLRVTADPNNTNVALPGSEVVLLGTNSTFANIGDPNSNTGAPSCQTGNIYVQDCIAADSPSHSIGTLAFGTDGSLFVSSGDGAHYNYVDVRALRALSLDSLNGKILRINPFTGGGLPDNPFYDGNPNSNRSKVYDLGLRNPFRTTINTLTNVPFIGDVGYNVWEEVDTGRGKNFGWPCYEGSDTGSAQQGGYKNLTATSSTCSALYAQGLSAVQAPLYAYDHSQGNSSVQVGGFYRGIVYPPQYQNALFISDYNADWIRYLTFDVNGNATVNNFGTDVAPVGGIVQLLTGPDTNLYYVAYNGPIPNTSEVRRIRYVAGGNTPPSANASADPDSGYVPLTVSFSSLGSFDPDAQALTYFWNFGDGNSSTASNPSYTYLTSGSFTVTLTITDSMGDTGSDSVTIDVGNLQPVADIITPAKGFAYNTGDTINYSGTGIDNEDGNLSGANLQWDILLHHNQHIHFDSIPGLTGNSGSFVIPDHGDDTWVELCLTVTDSGGLNDQECANLTPNTVTLSFATVPSGLELEYDGVTYTAPFNVVTNVNSERDLIAPQTQGCYNFSSWSDGGTASHQVTIGSTPQTFIATYLPCPVTVTVNPNQSKVYGGAEPVFIYVSSNPAATFTGVLSRTVGENVGGYSINQGTLAVVDSTRFSIASFVPANFTINPKVASVTPNSASKIFGDVDPAFTGTLTGFLPADNVTAVYGRTPGETAGPYTISAALSPVGVLDNYNITYNTANFTIAQASALITLGNLNFTYNGTPKSTTATTNPPNLPFSITYDGSATAPTDAGSYTVLATINHPNYAGTASGTLVIARATVSPNITAADKVYDGATTATIASRALTGVIGTDDVTLSGGTANFTNANVGTWPVTATGLTLSGADAGNYQLSSTTANTSAAITRATIAVILTIHNASHTPIISAAIGDVIHNSATVTGISATPTGNVTFKVFNNLTCSGLGSGTGIIPLDSAGVADPSNTTTVTGGSLSFRATYNGDSNYVSQTSLCAPLNIQSAFTSADNTTFNVGSAGSFTVTTSGVPTVSSISMSGSLPAGVIFTDNLNGTATLAGTPDIGTEGVYNLTLTATNGIPPDAVQAFTLTVDKALPPTISSLNTIASTRDNILSEFEVVSISVTKFTVKFNQDVISVDSQDSNYGDSAINPANYLLLRDNGNGFETVSCAQGAGGDDTPISIELVEYNDNSDAGPFVATLSVNDGLPLPNGYYRLYVCGTTSITNQFGVALAGNGLPDTDFIRNFQVSFPNGGGGGNAGGGVAAVSFAGGLLVPVTGFAPDQVTKLPAQPKDKAYTYTNDLRLDIPSLSLNMPIVGVDLKENGWDVTWLGNSAGYLEGSAYPTLSGNSILTGHVTDVNGNPGPFASLKDLRVGDKVNIHNSGSIYVYEVRQSELIFPGNLKTLFKHEDYEWLTLVTCETYNEKLDKFIYRRMVKAVLVSVIPEK
jgi:LPXTG-site transpeptidase (sortase) family protein